MRLCAYYGTVCLNFENSGSALCHCFQSFLIKNMGLCRLAQALLGLLLIMRRAVKTAQSIKEAGHTGVTRITPFEEECHVASQSAGEVPVSAQ